MAKKETQKKEKMVKETKAKKAEKVEMTETVKLTEEQKFELKETLLKTKYGIGGENFSLFPILLDIGLNQWIDKEYNISKLPKRIDYSQYRKNGRVRILPILTNNKTHYLVTILADKQLEIDIWDLKTEGKPYIKYTHYGKMGRVKLTDKEYLVTNTVTNKNKAFNQARKLAGLLKLDILNLEEQKELKDYYLKVDLDEKGIIYFKEYNGLTHKPTGKEIYSLDEYLNRKHIINDINILEMVR